MYLENADWLWPSLTLKIVFTLIIIGVASRGNAQASSMQVAKVTELANPLPIGEPIPDELWSTPLTLWNAEDHRTETITLGDYRGKVIILDFWATWCKSCIANMPRMHQLQDQFEEDIVVLPVTYENESTVSALFERTSNAGLLALRSSFQSIIIDSILRQAFPNPDRTIPYFTIIGKDGLLTGLAMPAQLNEQLLTSLVSGEDAYIPPLQAAPETPLLERSAKYTANRVAKPVYYSMLSGYMEGFSFPVGYVTDSVSGTRRDYYVNSPLLRLYASALSSGAPIRPNKRILLIDSAALLESDGRRNRQYNFREYNYCYEAIAPSWATKEERNSRMLAELNTTSGFKGEMRKRKLPCLIVHRADSTPDTAFIPTDEGVYIPMNSFVRRLNIQYDTAIPEVIDESGFTGKLFFDKNVDPGDIENIRKLLSAQGFTLEPETRMLDVFVLSDCEIPDIGSIPLTLTKFGYVREEGSYE